MRLDCVVVFGVEGWSNAKHATDFTQHFRHGSVTDTNRYEHSGVCNRQGRMITIH